MIDIDDDINLDDIWLIFDWYLGEIDDIMNEIDDNYTSLIVWW